MVSGACVVLMGLSRGPLPKPGQGALQPLRVYPTGVLTAPSLRSCTRRRCTERKILTSEKKRGKKMHFNFQPLLEKITVDKNKRL